MSGEPADTTPDSFQLNAEYLIEHTFLTNINLVSDTTIHITWSLLFMKKAMIAKTGL